MAAAPIVDDALDLDLLSIIGFDGRTIHGLQVHPNGVHVIYPLGCKVAVVEWKNKKQFFLEGHSNIITAVAVSRCGKYVGSGQINYMGFKALVILWDFEKRTALMKHDIHKVRVEALAFSKDSVFLYSLGGRDDGNVVATHIPTLEPMCGYPASGATSGIGLTLKSTNKRDVVFITAGEQTMRIWKLDPTKRNVRPTDINFNKLKRVIFCVAIDWRDEFAYCGTISGDILKVTLNFSDDDRILDVVRPPRVALSLGKLPLKKKKDIEAENYSQGVRDLLILEEYERKLIVGTGDGTVEMVTEVELPDKKFLKFEKIKAPTMPMLSVIRTTTVDAPVTTLQFYGKKDILVGTEICEIYLINIATFDTKLMVTCHTTTIYDLAFPRDYSEVFATAGKNDVRVWHTESCKELLRISVPNFTCAAVQFTTDGRSIISGWNDGCIRAFTPQSGRLIYTIHDGHNKGVTALAITSCGTKLVSGGGEGQVRIWELSPNKHKLAAILKDHKGPVSAIDIKCDDTQAVSASTDGSCIVWDILRKVRYQILFANSLFMACKYNPEGCQVLTSGTDRKVQYWECYDGSLIRDLEGSTSAAINSLDISADGRYFITGSNDCLVKVWNYDEGYTTHIGVGHAGIITGVRFSPDCKYVISVSDDGAIFTWKCPFEMRPPPQRPESVGSRSTCSLRSMQFRLTTANERPATEGQTGEPHGDLPGTPPTTPTSGAGDIRPPPGENVTRISTAQSVRSSVAGSENTPRSTPKGKETKAQKYYPTARPPVKVCTPLGGNTSRAYRQAAGSTSETDREEKMKLLTAAKAGSAARRLGDTFMPRVDQFVGRSPKSAESGKKFTTPSKAGSTPTDYHRRADLSDDSDIDVTG